MGTDPEDSVVDADLRHHGTRNLVVLGAGVFPTCPAGNPTLTLSALAVRSAERLFQGGGMTWSRRAFVRWGLATGGLAMLGTWAWWRRDAADLIVASLERRVGFLRVDRTTFRTFAQSYIQRIPRHESRLSIASMVAGPLQWVRPHQWGGGVSESFRRLDDTVLGT